MFELVVCIGLIFLCLAVNRAGNELENIGNQLERIGDDIEAME